MEAKTLRALRGSLRKWEKIVAGTGEDHGHHNCPLCKLFYSENELDKNCCVGCPVSAKTRVPWCLETPYDDWLDAKPDDEKPNPPEAIRAAKAEVKFLKGLLP